MMLFLLGCDATVTQVNLLGMVQDAPFNAGTPVEGAKLEARNRDGEVTGEDESDAEGLFSVPVDSGVSFYLTLSHPDLVATGFSGVAGVNDFDAGTGYPWLATPSWVEALRAEHGNCPESSSEGGIVVGEVRAAIAQVDDVNQWPTLGGTSVQVIDHTGATHDGCYLDDQGVSVEGASGTGATGMFAVFGVPAGAINVAATVERSDGELGTDVFEFVIPEAGLVPIFPTALWL
jgi:hypothetical protein